MNALLLKVALAGFVLMAIGLLITWAVLLWVEKWWRDHSDNEQGGTGI